MKRVLVGIMLLLALQISPAAATPLDELTRLAGNFPDDTQVFIAFRVDDAFFAAVDDVIARAGATAPELVGEVPSIRRALDDSALAMTRGEEDFESLFRSWMGNTAALAVDNTASAMMGGDVRALIALEVTDRDATEAFLDDYVAANGRFEKSERYGGTLYESESSFNSHYLLLDDVVLATLSGQQSARSLNLRVRDSLAESEAFTAALATLPADQYNIVAYLNLPEIIAPIAAFAPMALGEGAPEDFDLTPVVEALGALTFGFTMVDEQSLVMDASLIVNDPTVFLESGVPLGDLPALDLDFAAYVPSNAGILIQEQNLGGSIMTLIAAVEEVGVQLEEAGLYPLLQGTRNPPYRPAELDVLQSFNLDDIATFIQQSFRGMTGLTLEEGLGWMSADYATYIGYSLTDPNTLNLSLGVVTAVTDANAAAAFRDGLQNAFDQGGVVYTTEGDNLVLSFLEDAFEEGMRELAPEADLIIGLSDDVLVFGTRPSAEHALDPQDGGLAGTAAYQAARGAFLPDTHLLWYLSLPALLNPMRDTLISADASAAQLYALVDFIQSMSITANSDATGTGVVRFAITLGD